MILMNGKKSSHCEWCLPGLIILGSIKYQTEETMSSKSASNTPPWLFHRFLSQIPALFKFLFCLPSLGCDVGYINQINFFLSNCFLLCSVGQFGILSVARQEVQAGQPDRKQRQGNENRRILGGRKTIPLQSCPDTEEGICDCLTEKGTESCD